MYGAVSLTSRRLEVRNAECVVESVIGLLRPAKRPVSALSLNAVSILSPLALRAAPSVKRPSSLPRPPKLWNRLSLMNGPLWHAVHLALPTNRSEPRIADSDRPPAPVATY